MEKLDEHTKEEEIRVILFQVDDLRLFARLTNVLEILEVNNIRKLPCSRNYLDGLFEYRKKILPYYNTRKRLNRPDNQGKLSFVFHKQGIDFAFKIDKTLGTLYASKKDISKPTSEIEGIKHKYIISVLFLEDTKVLELDFRALFID